MNDTEALKLAFCKCKGMVIQLSPRILQVYFYDNHGTKYGDIFTAITILKSLIIMSLTEITLPIIHQPSMRLMHLMPFMTSWMTNPLSSRPVKVSSYITPKRILYPASHKTLPKKPFRSTIWSLGSNNGTGHTRKSSHSFDSSLYEK